MKTLQFYATILILPFAMLFTTTTAANVARPALDIQDYAGDAGFSLTATGPSIDATAFSIVTNGNPIDIPDETFTLTSTAGSFDSLAGFGSFAGSINIGSLLSADFANLNVFDLSGGVYQFAGDLTYTGGSLMGNLTSGRIEGIASNSQLVAKIGAVAAVPLPAAAWLFGSGLLGLIRIARRKI